MRSWEPNKLVQDEKEVAYSPTDKEGKKIAVRVTMYLRGLMYRVKTNPTRYVLPARLPEHSNCRCVILPKDPTK